MLPSCGGTRVLSFYTTTFSQFRNTFNNFIFLNKFKMLFSSHSSMCLIHQVNPVIIVKIVIIRRNLLLFILLTVFFLRSGTFQKEEDKYRKVLQCSVTALTERCQQHINKTQPTAVRPQTGNTETACFLSPKAGLDHPQRDNKHELSHCTAATQSNTHVICVCMCVSTWTWFLWACL